MVRNQPINTQDGIKIYHIKEEKIYPIPKVAKVIKHGRYNWYTTNEAPTKVDMYIVKTKD